MPISNKYKNDPEVQKALADAWLNIRVDEDKLGNPLNWPAEFDDNPEQYITWVMSQPEYFYFVCKEIMGIELSPTQCVVLKELWNRKFPMYIASRGFGKALRPDTLVKTKNDWARIKDLAPGDKVYGGHGKLCKVTNTTHIQKDLDFYKITFQDGRTIECCKDHQWKVWDVTLRKWSVKSTIDIFQDYFWIKHKKDRQHPHREYKYAIPLNEKIENEAAPPIFSLVYYIEYGDYFEYRFEDELSAENYSLWKRSLGLYVELDGLSVKVYGEKPVKSSHAKSKLEKVFITDIEYIGKGDGMCIMVDSPDHTYIAEDYIVTHNSFLLGVYTLLRLMFMPGRKIVIAGAAFRQSRIIFEYMENIYKNSALLRDLFGPYKGTIKHETDAHRFYFNESVAIAIPIGCLVGDSLVTTDFGIRNIEELRHQDKYNVWSNSKYRNVGFFFDNGFAPTKKIVTHKGYEIEGTHNHKIKILDNLEIKWKRFDDIKIGDAVLIDITKRWHNSVIEYDYDKAYNLGCMIACGDYKEFPNAILSASKQCMSICLLGIFHSSCKITHSIDEQSIELNIRSRTSIRQLQYILLHYGIISCIRDDKLVIEDEGVDLFYDAIGLRSEKIETDSIFYDTVDSVEDSITQLTYDINVPDGNEYCANGFYSHNTGEKIRGLRANDLICVTKDTLVQTDIGLVEIGKYLDGQDKTVMNMNNEFERPDNIVITKPTDVYQIKTRSGFTFKCSAWHQVMTTRGWKVAKDLTKKDYLEIDSNDYFPQEYVCRDNLIIDEDLGWLFGVLISEGGVETRYRIEVTNSDYDLITRVKDRIKFDWKEHHKDAYVDKRGFNCKESWVISYNNTEYRTKLKNLGLDYLIHKDKKIPWSILQSPKSVVIEFLKGLFEGDGTGFQITPSQKNNKKTMGLAYYSSSYELCHVLQILLTKFGIFGAICNRKSKLSKRKQWMVAFRGEAAVLLYELLKLDKWGEMKHETSFQKSKFSYRINNGRCLVETWRAGKNHYIGTFDTEEEAKQAFNDYWDNARHVLKVKSVELLPDKEVLYDFHMPETSSFIGNGFVQHNCDEFNCMVSGVLVETENGLVRIDDFDKLDSKVLTGSDNKVESPTKFIKTPPTDVYEIKLRNGYVIRCSYKHQVMTDKGWKNVLDLRPGDFVERTPKGNFKFGTSKFDGLDEESAWLFGRIVSTDYTGEIDDKFYNLGLENVSLYERKIPWTILKSPESIVRAFLKGLLADNYDIFFSVSERLCRDVQVLMYKLGYDGKIYKRNNIQWVVEWKDDCCNFDSNYQEVLDVIKLEEKEVLYDYYLPESHSFYGDGFRQHNSVNRELFETVLVGFTAVTSNPIQNQKDAAAIKLAKEKGWWEPDMFDNTLGDNQLIISGTSGYSFQPFYHYWKDWHDIISSKGDKSKLESYFKRRSEDSGMDVDDVAKTLNHQHYSIIRIPIEKIPEGIMDADSISRARATMHSGTFINEYGACQISEETLFLTDKGYVKYKHLAVGDRVLGEDGLFNKITKKTRRHYSGPAIDLKTLGSNIVNSVTADHLFHNGDDYCKAETLKGKWVVTPKLKHLTGLTCINTKDYIEGPDKEIKLDHAFGELIGRYAGGDISAADHYHPDIFPCLSPGYVLPEILYSNADFMHGFLDGVHNTDVILYGTSNYKLLSQFKMVASFFDMIYDFNYNSHGDKYKINPYLPFDDYNYIYNNVYVFDEYHYEGMVYNIEVENNPSYVTTVGLNHNCFSDDSNGFFKRAVIENCTVGHKPIHFKSCGEVDFEASLYGHHERSYVIGIDPASEVDNLAVVIVEMWPEHRRIVYCWTINKARQREEVKAGLTDEHDYNSYCARKIRNLMRRFKTARIMMDSQGGGYAIMEAFRNRKNIEDGEQVLLPAINEDKPAETDMQEGLHIVELVNFRDNKWLGEANHTMRKDLENRLLLFPRFDAISLGRAEYFDENTSHMYDSLEDTTMEIEELKDELSNIIQSKTSTGLDKWDTPEQVMPGGKKGRMKKDRYSALLMANMGARILMEDDFMLPFESWGDFSKSTKEDKGGMYTSSFFSEWAEDFYSEY